MADSTPFSLFGFNSPALLALLGVIFSCLYLCYRWALPRPIPGIPYNKEATKSLLGDVLAMVQYVGKTKEVAPYFTQQTLKLRSPIIQLFIRPFGKPYVLISDFREIQGNCLPTPFFFSS
jgi:hypothetical protein